MTDYLPIIPAVQSINYTNSTFTMSKQNHLFCHDQLTESDQFALSTVVKDVDKFFHLQYTNTRLEQPKNWKFGAIGSKSMLNKRLATQPNQPLADEGYAITISPDGIFWWAETERGYF